MDQNQFYQQTNTRLHKLETISTQDGETFKRIAGELNNLHIRLETLIKTSERFFNKLNTDFNHFRETIDIKTDNKIKTEMLNSLDKKWYNLQIILGGMAMQTTVVLGLIYIMIK